MNLTTLEKEIIQHRLDVPDAMADALTHSINIDYKTAFNLYNKWLPGLISKLTSDELLNEWERWAVIDIATCDVYPRIAESAIGFEWEKGKKMTRQWSSKIWNTSKNLQNKLLPLVDGS